MPAKVSQTYGFGRQSHSKRPGRALMNSLSAPNQKYTTNTAARAAGKNNLRKFMIIKLSAFFIFMEWTFRSVGGASTYQTASIL